MLDPLVLRIICLGFALLFISAAAHKFSDRVQFAGILKDYKIVPATLTGVLASFIPFIELCLGIAWLGSGLPFVPTTALALISMTLLGIYAFAIGLNLARGRRHIDCGCHFASSFSATDKPKTAQILSPALVFRNILLIVVAAATLLPSSFRELGILDYFSMFTATLAVVLLFGAFNQLLANFSSINAWRKTHG